MELKIKQNEQQQNWSKETLGANALKSDFESGWDVLRRLG